MTSQQPSMTSQPVLLPKSMEDRATEWLDQSGIGLEEHVSDHGNPAYAVEKREAIHRASDEAKALITIILNAPGEFMKIFGREKSPTMRRLHVISVIVRGGKTYQEAVEIFQEAKDLVSAIL
jgi:hypothetical protein